LVEIEDSPASLARPEIRTPAGKVPGAFSQGQIGAEPFTRLRGTLPGLVIHTMKKKVYLLFKEKLFNKRADNSALPGPERGSE